MGTLATVRLIEGVRLIRCRLNTGFTVVVTLRLLVGQVGVQELRTYFNGGGSFLQETLIFTIEV